MQAWIMITRDVVSAVRFDWVKWWVLFYISHHVANGSAKKAEIVFLSDESVWKAIILGLQSWTEISVSIRGSLFFQYTGCRSVRELL